MTLESKNPMKNETKQFLLPWAPSIDGKRILDRTQSFVANFDDSTSSYGPDLEKVEFACLSANSHATLLKQRDELREALKAVDKLTCNVPLMSREVQAHFERNPGVDAYRCELCNLLLEIRSIARSGKAPAVEQWVPPASTVEIV